MSAELVTTETRKGAIRLAIQDALEHTALDEGLTNEAFTVMRQGIEMLEWGEITDQQEERWLTSMLETGWQLTPSGDDTSPLHPKP
jgi:hypothetical protein